jgi:hypothetical protein|nr:MAG TPA: hypothetical protein [Bacteriophage sp.]
MKEQGKPNYLTCKDQFCLLSRTEKTAFRERYLAETGMSYPAFYYKLRQNSFKSLEEQKFNEIMKDMNHGDK